MDKAAFSSGGYGTQPQQLHPPPPPPLQQHQQQQTVENAAQHAAIQLALAAFVQQGSGISVVDIVALIDHLEMLMKDCSQANIQVQLLSTANKTNSSSSTHSLCKTTRTAIKAID